MTVRELTRVGIFPRRRQQEVAVEVDRQCVELDVVAGAVLPLPGGPDRNEDVLALVVLAAGLGAHAERRSITLCHHSFPFCGHVRLLCPVCWQIEHFWPARPEPLVAGPAGS